MAEFGVVLRAKSYYIYFIFWFMIWWEGWMHMYNNIHKINNPMLDKNLAAVRKANEEKIQIQRNIERNTQKIAENTEWLSQSVNLIRINNERQTELLELITEILALANESDAEVAESKLKNILNNVQGFKDNFELTVFLKDLGDGIINLISNGNF